MKALITWWTKWIGFAIAKVLAKEGYNIVMTYFHDHDAAAESQSIIQWLGVGVDIVQADSGSKVDIQKVFSDYNSFTVLVNNVGKSFPNWDPNDRNAILQHHLMWTVRYTELFMEQLNELWSIVNISSIFWKSPESRYKWIHREAYCCAKAGVDMYTRICSSKYKWVCHVNAVAPWNTLTPWWEWADSSFVESRKWNSLLWRFIHPNEIAQAVLSIIKNPWINGQIITVDGGVVARWYE